MSRLPFPRPPNGLPQPQAGPSRQPYYQPPPPQPYMTQPYTYGLPPNPYNVSGGYNPYYQAVPQVYQPIPAQPIPQQYSPQPYHSPSFGQSLFKPTATPEGYAYSTAYLSASTPEQQPPNKRQKVVAPHAGGSIGANGASGAKAWRNCSVAGCKFLGPGEEVEIHEGDRHLIFPAGHKVERSEEEERFARRKGPPPAIEGTNITLQTQEDIDKWIAERKAKWPSAKRVAEKQAEYQAAVDRGEAPARGRGRGRGRGGVVARRAMDPAARAEDWGRPQPETVKSEGFTDGSNRGRGSGGRERGRGRGGRGRPGRGDHDRVEKGDSRDSGWPRQGAKSPARPAQVTRASSVVNTTVGLPGVDDYESDSASDSESSTSSSDSTTSDLSSDSDSSLTLEAPGDGVSAVVPKPVEEVTAVPEPTAAPQRPVCRFYGTHGRCNKGKACRFAHTAPGGHVISAGTGNNTNKKQTPRSQRNKANPLERPSMLSALLADPINNTISQLSQTIRFLVANNMLEGVELHPGQADELERQRNKVVEVETTDGGETPKISPKLDAVDMSI